MAGAVSIMGGLLMQQEIKKKMAAVGKM